MIVLSLIFVMRCPDCSVSYLFETWGGILTHYTFDFKVGAAVQLDRGLMNTSQVKPLVIVSVLWQDRVRGFMGLGLPQANVEWVAAAQILESGSFWIYRGVGQVVVKNIER